MASNFSALTLTILLSFFFHFSARQVSAAAEPYVVIEDGFAVTTVVDGHKLGISPYSVILKPGSSDLVVLDYSGSAFFTVPLPVSKGFVFFNIGNVTMAETTINRLSGTGEIGYIDGEPGSAMFNKPRSFAIDSKGNVYVADKNNNVIRKINTSGVTTTIAGVKGKTGRDDGLGKNARFSNDFELVFIPEKCALLVSDHGNQLVRQIDLNAEDCKRESSGSSGYGVSAIAIWSVTVGAACIVGFVVGLVARPYIVTREGTRINHFSATWKLCLINLGKLVQILCFAVRSGIVNLSLICSLFERLFLQSLSHLSFVFKTNHIVPQTRALQKEQASLLDSDIVATVVYSETAMISEKYANQLKDLMTFDGSLGLTNPNEGEAILHDSYENGKVDKMIDANLMNFADVAKESTLVDGRSCLVKRR